jgi:hypothetical protein
MERHHFAAGTVDPLPTRGTSLEQGTRRPHQLSIELRGKSALNALQPLQRLIIVQESNFQDRA